MAWIDDRIWCHPKTVGLSAAAFAAYVKGIALSSGLSTSGHLNAGHQSMIGATAKVRTELVDAGLWDVNGAAPAVSIHDWDEHNSKRDARRAADRDRKRRLREAGKP